MSIWICFGEDYTTLADEIEYMVKRLDRSDQLPNPEDLVMLSHLQLLAQKLDKAIESTAWRLMASQNEEKKNEE